MGKLCGVDVEESYPWPTCEMHYELATEYSDFYSWVWASLYDPHGPVHIWIGGVMDCKETYEKIARVVGKDKARMLASISFVHRKDMFRSGFFSCEGTAEVSEQADEVRLFSCRLFTPFAHEQPPPLFRLVVAARSVCCPPPTPDTSVTPLSVPYFEIHICIYVPFLTPLQLETFLGTTLLELSIGRGLGARSMHR